MKVTYNGENSSLSQFGYAFRVKGREQDVDVTDEAHLAKFRGNPEFDVEEEDCNHVSTDLHHTKAIAKIAKLDTLEALKAFAADDERASVVKAADARAEELQEA